MKVFALCMSCCVVWAGTPAGALAEGKLARTHSYTSAQSSGGHSPGS